LSKIEDVDEQESRSDRRKLRRGVDSVEEEDDRSLTGGKASTTSIKDVSEAASEDKEEEF